MIIAMGVFTPFCISAPSSRKSVHFVGDSNEKMCNVTAESTFVAAESTFVHDIMPPLKRARLSIDTPFDKPFVMPNFENLVTVPIKQYNFGPNFYRDLYVEKMEVEEEEEEVDEVDEIIHQLGLLEDEEVEENDWGIIPLRLEEEFNDEEEEEDMAMDIEEEEEEEEEDNEEEDEEQDEEDDEEPEPDYNRCRIA